MEGGKGMGDTPLLEESLICLLLSVFSSFLSSSLVIMGVMTDVDKRWRMD